MGQGQVGIISKILGYPISQAKNPGRFGLPGVMTLPPTEGGAKKNGLMFCCLKSKVQQMIMSLMSSLKQEWSNNKELIKCLKRGSTKLKALRHIQPFSGNMTKRLQSQRRHMLLNSKECMVRPMKWRSPPQIPQWSHGWDGSPTSRVCEGSS